MTEREDGKRAKVKRKRFLPQFRPMYVQVIAEDRDKFVRQMLPIMDIQYDGQNMRIIVRDVR